MLLLLLWLLFPLLPLSNQYRPLILGLLFTQKSISTRIIKDKSVYTGKETYLYTHAYTFKGKHGLKQSIKWVRGWAMGRG